MLKPSITLRPPRVARPLNSFEQSLEEHMTRKPLPHEPEAPLVDRSQDSSHKAPSDAPSKRGKLSLESLLVETPENSRDEAWEKMASVGLEF